MATSDDDYPRDLSKPAVRRATDMLRPQTTQAAPNEGGPADKAAAILRQLAPRLFNAKARQQQLGDAERQQVEGQ